MDRLSSPSDADELTLLLLLPEDEDSAVDVYHLSNQVFFRFGNQLVAASLLDVKFPDYERVVPKDIDSKVHLNREELSDSLGRVLLVCRQKDQNPVAHTETAGGTLTIRSDAGEIGKGTEELEAEVSGADIKVALNPQYLIEVLKTLGGDQVTLNWINEVSPVMITTPREPDFTYIWWGSRLEEASGGSPRRC